MLFSILVLSGSLMAQGDMPRRQKKVTYEQMTEKMVKELQLDEKQQKKVAKLNKKYKTLIEGEQAERPQGQRPPMGERPSGRPSGGMGGPGSRNQNIIYSGATELKAAVTETGKTYQSSKIDENALLINTKEAVTIAQPTINKTGSSSGGDNCSFYGVNAALLVKGGSTTTIKGGTITSDADGANGVFSYGGNGGHNGGEGDGTTVIVEDTKITTTGGGSGGIMTTGGGVMKAKNLTINTSGRSSAPIRTDRGGGVVTVEGGSYTSSGPGSPVKHYAEQLRDDGEQYESQRSCAVPRCHHDLSVVLWRCRCRQLAFHDERRFADKQKGPSVPCNQHKRYHHADQRQLGE